MNTLLTTITKTTCATIILLAGISTSEASFAEVADKDLQQACMVVGKPSSDRLVGHLNAAVKADDTHAGTASVCTRAIFHIRKLDEEVDELQGENRALQAGNDALQETLISERTASAAASVAMEAELAAEREANAALRAFVEAQAEKDSKPRSTLGSLAALMVGEERVKSIGASAFGLTYEATAQAALEAADTVSPSTSPAGSSEDGGSDEG